MRTDADVHRRAARRGREPPRGPRHYETVLDAASLERWLPAIARADLVCFDTETTRLDPHEGGDRRSVVRDRAGPRCYVPLARRYPGAPDQLRSSDVLAPARAVVRDPARSKLGQNVKYDQHVLANHGLALRGVAHDTLLQSYVLESHKPHDMDNLAWRHLNAKTITYAEVAGKGAKQIGFDQVSIDARPRTRRRMPTSRCSCTRLHPRLAADPKLDHVYTVIELPVREILFEMERAGVLLDTALLAAQSRELGEHVLALEQQAYAARGQPFNLHRRSSSARSCSTESCRAPQDATGQPSTDEEVLPEFAADYPLPKLLLEHRALSKLKSTYTDKLPQMVDRRTGRVHTTLLPGDGGDRTARVVRSEPAEHPVRTAEGRASARRSRAARARARVRRLSQIELRIMGICRGIRRWWSHSTRRGHPPRDRRRDPPRPGAGSSANSAATSRQSTSGSSTGWARSASPSSSASSAAPRSSSSTATSALPGVAEYMQRTRELAREHGYVETVFGRRLWLPDIKAAGGPRRAAAERAAIDAPMRAPPDLDQAGDDHRAGLATRRAPPARIVLQVHDELVFEVPEAEVERVTRTAAEDDRRRLLRCRWSPMSASAPTGSRRTDGASQSVPRSCVARFCVRR